MQGRSSLARTFLRRVVELLLNDSLAQILYTAGGNVGFPLADCRAAD